MAKHSTPAYPLDVEGLRVWVQRKRIRHLYLRVRPPHGEIWVSACDRHSDADIATIIRQRYDWIVQQRQRLAERERRMPSVSALHDGAMQWVLGQAYPLVINPHARRNRIVLSSEAMHMHTTPAADERARAQLLLRFQRREAKRKLDDLTPAWAERMGVDVTETRVRSMKTLWGSCNPVARRIWLNVDLIRYPLACFEYVLVHELVHLLERGHNARFYRFMDAYLPDWRQRREQLNGRYEID